MPVTLDPQSDRTLLLRKLRRAKDRHERSPSMATARYLAECENGLRNYLRRTLRVIEGGKTDDSD